MYKGEYKIIPSQYIFQRVRREKKLSKLSDLPEKVLGASAEKGECQR